MNCSALLHGLPLTATSILFVLACAGAGALVMRVYVSIRWHRGIYHQKRQEQYDKLFGDTQ